MNGSTFSDLAATFSHPRFGVYRAGTLRAAVHGLPVIAERVAGGTADRVRCKMVGFRQ